MEPMSTRTRMTLVALAVLVETHAGWALTAAERQCQQGLASGGRQLLERSMAALAACQRAIERGTLPAGTDCRSEATASAARSAAATRLAISVGQACSASTAASLHAGGECAGARTVDDLIACVRDGH